MKQRFGAGLCSATLLLAACGARSSGSAEQAGTIVSADARPAAPERIAVQSSGIADPVPVVLAAIGMPDQPPPMLSVQESALINTPDMHSEPIPPATDD